MNTLVSSRSFPARRNSSPAWWRTRAWGSQRRRPDETPLEPAVHRRGLHRPVAVLADEAAQVWVRAGVPPAHRIEDVVVRLRAGFEREPGEVGPQILEGNRHVGRPAAFAVHPELATLEVDVAPVQEPQLVLSKRQTARPMSGLLPARQQAPPSESNGQRGQGRHYGPASDSNAFSSTADAAPSNYPAAPAAPRQSTSTPSSAPTTCSPTSATPAPPAGAGTESSTRPALATKAGGRGQGNPGSHAPSQVPARKGRLSKNPVLVDGPSRSRLESRCGLRG
jgi:hypothetical protein